MHKVLYECVTGSRMHGTHNENSDIDSRVVYRDSLREKLSPFLGTTVSTDSETDRSYYELTHFVKMLVKCNPTSIELAHGIEWTGDGALIRSMAEAAMDTTSYAKQNSGMIMGMVKKGTPKSLHHAARIHTHLKMYLDTGYIVFDASRYENYDELMAIKRGEITTLPSHYTDKLEPTRIWHTQDLDKLEQLVYNEYMEDVK